MVQKFLRKTITFNLSVILVILTPSGGPECPFQAGFAWFLGGEGENMGKVKKKRVKNGTPFLKVLRKSSKAKTRKRKIVLFLLRKNNLLLWKRVDLAWQGKRWKYLFEKDERRTPKRPAAGRSFEKDGVGHLTNTTVRPGENENRGFSKSRKSRFWRICESGSRESENQNPFTFAAQKFFWHPPPLKGYYRSSGLLRYKGVMYYGTEQLYY